MTARPVVLVFLLVLALFAIGARGLSKNPMGDGYFNEVKRTGVGKVRFHKTQTGAAVSPATTKRVYFLDIVNTSANVAEMTIYTPTGYGSPASIDAFVGAYSTKSYDGVPIDSVNVDTATHVSSSTPLYFTGRLKR